MEKMSFDAVIIGSGLGGLTAGATLAKYGKKVLVLEQHYIPGGCATAFKRKDYVMEVGLHEMDGLHEYDFKKGIFDFLNIWEHIEFKKVPDLYRIKSQNFDAVVPHGKEEVIKELSKEYPEDKKAIRKFLDLMEEVLKEIPDLPDGWKAKLMLPIFPLLYPNIVKASKISLGCWLDKNIKNESLKIILQGNLSYYHDDPHTMSLIYFSAAQSSYMGGGGHFIKGGSQQLSNYLVSMIETGGGQVLLGKKVERIIIENGKAVGVAYKDSFNEVIEEKEIFAPITIANAAIPLVKKMLPTPQALKLGKKIDHLEEACSLISVYMGFKTDLKSFGVKNYSTFLLGEGTDNLKIFGERIRGKDWEKKPFVFVDYSQIDAGLAPEGKTVGVICAGDYLSNWENLSLKAYKKEKEKVANILLKRLEKEFPGIREHIEYYEVGTAKTIQSYTLNPKGTAYGYAQTPKQAGMGRLPVQSPIKNLYFGSAWAMPGGGFTGAIISGFLCGEKVNEQLGTSSVKSSKIVDERVVALVERKEIAKDTFELIFEKPKEFQYKAGQYVILSLNDPTFTQLDIPHRSLSMVSHPDEKVLRFAMRTSKSSFKKSCQAMQPNEKATIYGSLGDFSINPTESKSKRSVVFLISGIGITPVLALLKELQKNEFPKDIHLFYSNRSKEQAAYHQYFCDVKFKNFYYHPIFSGKVGRINIQTLQPLQELAQYDFYMVGTSEFLQSMNKMLEENHVPKEQVVMDDFG